MQDGWRETELYTIYTPSTEGGLVISDIDGDGLPDLLCGNYWMKSPTAFELPWREFAIDTWNEEEGSGDAAAWPGAIRSAWRHSGICGRLGSPGSSVPADPRQLCVLGRRTIWNLLARSRRGCIFVNKDLFILESDPPGRVLRFRRRQGNGFGHGKELIRTNSGDRIWPPCPAMAGC